MCGLTGFLGGSGDDRESILRKMNIAIASRGPDSAGYWHDHEAGIALGHRRLAIVDVSPAGAQPMTSICGRWVIVFNGEIYNHQDLRAEIERARQAPNWRGHSDTETLLAGLVIWGIEGTIRKCIGMFAIAVWDRQERTLTLGRDRLGEKPLYYGWQGHGKDSVFLFGSELKALRGHPAFAAQIDREALGSFMRQMAVSGTASIYEGIKKVAPGTLLEVSLRSPEPQLRRYWSVQEAVQGGLDAPFEGEDGQAVDALEILLRDAVRRQMVADVPLGAFLSGGVDSSTIVALMQAQSARPVKTFSIGFHEAIHNEAGYAKAVASHLGTDHTELYVSPRQALDVIPCLPTLYDEPFADSSQIPTFLVSHMTRQHVAVALSGDAGDELFAGYNRYQLTASLWPRLTRIPKPLREALAWSLTRFAPETLSRLAGYTPLGQRWANVGYKLHKGASVMAADSVDELYQGMVTTGWSHPSDVVQGQPAYASPLQMPALAGLNDIERMMALDLLNYLPDDILTKVDRAAMGVSLETRVPFLDHRVVEFAWRLPMQHKLRAEGSGHTTKWALRQVLYRHVPRALIERPKMGFGVPIDSWLRGPLRAWAENLLDESRLRREGFFNSQPIRKKWHEHLTGQRNWQNQIWCVLMFQAWLDENYS